MFRLVLSSAIRLLTAAAAATATSAASPSVIIVSPLYQPDAGPQIGGPPYARPGFTIYPPSSALPPRLTNPAANPYSPGAQTCVAASYTCPAPAPDTPGNPCVCPTNGGGAIEGVVR